MALFLTFEVNYLNEHGKKLVNAMLHSAFTKAYIKQPQNQWLQCHGAQNNRLPSVTSLPCVDTSSLKVMKRMLHSGPGTGVELTCLWS